MRPITLIVLLAILSFGACKKDAPTPPIIIPSDPSWLKEIDSIYSTSIESKVLLSDSITGLAAVSSLEEKIFSDSAQLHLLAKNTAIPNEDIKFPDALDLKLSSFFNVKISLPYGKKGENTEQYLQRVLKKGTFPIRNPTNLKSSDAWDFGVYWIGRGSFSPKCLDYAQSKFGAQTADSRIVINGVGFKDINLAREYFIKGYIENTSLYISNNATHDLYKKFKKIAFYITFEPISLKGLNFEKPFLKSAFLGACEDSLPNSWRGTIDDKSFCFSSSNYFFCKEGKNPETFRLQQSEILPKGSEFYFNFVLNRKLMAYKRYEPINFSTPNYTDKREFAGLGLRFFIRDDIKAETWLDSLTALKKIKILTKGEDKNNGIIVNICREQETYYSKLGSIGRSFDVPYASSYLGNQNNAYLEITNVKIIEDATYKTYKVKGRIVCTLYNSPKIDDNSDVFGSIKDSEFETSFRLIK